MNSEIKYEISNAIGFLCFIKECGPDDDEDVITAHQDLELLKSFGIDVDDAIEKHQKHQEQKEFVDNLDKLPSRMRKKGFVAIDSDELPF